ncbi:MAG: hypothetical protein ACI4WS_04925 [Oscillospiraceae bacterium]
MKKRIAIISSALLLLSGCSSGQARGDSAPADQQDTMMNTAQPGAGQENSVPAIAEVPADTEIALEIAWVTEEIPDEPRTEPPQLQVVYSGDGLAHCAAMTLGTYTWDTGDSIVCADSIGPVACAAEGLITAVVDLDAVSENEPKINLWGGAEITGVQLFPMEGDEVIPLEFTPDGVISFPTDVYDGVACVYADFPEGNAGYFFKVKRSLTDPSSPPELRVFSGDYIGFKMTKGGFNWTYTKGDETCTVTTDIASPWEMYQKGRVRPDLWVLPGEVLSIMLPEGGEITSAEYRRSESDIQPLEYSGDKIIMPREPLAAVCSVTVQMPGGRCEYLFSVNVGESASSPAYEGSGS